MCKGCDSMRKLNSKGMTTIEIILCFVLISVISVSLYHIVSSYDKKRMLEENKLKIVNYKNILTKEIQTDLIHRGVHEVALRTNPVEGGMDYELELALLDGSHRLLKIFKQAAYSSYHPGGVKNIDDSYMISYGNYCPGGNTSDCTTDVVEYPLPDLGSFMFQDGETGTEWRVQKLSINDVEIHTDDDVLSIYIGFYHPELGNRYAIDIVNPIGFNF